jgi:hypothetical protein
MNRRTRAHVALASALPCLLAVLVYLALAAAGTAPWSAVPAVLIALAILAAVIYVRLRPTTSPADQSDVA